MVILGWVALKWELMKVMLSIVERHVPTFHPK
jgi:hypothetical protein